MEQLVKAVIDLGLPAVLLLILVRYFLKVDMDRAKQIEELYSQFTVESANREEQFKADIKRKEKEYRERENLLVAESERREEILKAEAGKREYLLRTEAGKRETALLSTIESFSDTMREIADMMNEIKNTATQMRQRMGSMEKLIIKYQQNGEEMIAE